MKRDDPRHGTFAGWQVHRREGKRPCKPCREAQNAYMREYRKTAKPYPKYGKARNRAITRLIAAHPDEYRRFYDEEASA